MSDATPAIVFIVMLIAPCAIALLGDKKKSKDGDAAPVAEKPAAERSVAEKPKATPAIKPAPLTAKAPSASIPVFTPPPVVEVREPRVPRAYTQERDPYAQAARLYAQPESSFVQPYKQEPAVQAQPVAPSRQQADQDAAEALLAQAAAAKAHAAELAAAARAAQAKAYAATQLAREAALDAQEAHRAAAYERDVQAQITAQEHARTASGEAILPESHPSLDFPRSGSRGRRAA